MPSSEETVSELENGGEEEVEKLEVFCEDMNWPRQSRGNVFERNLRPILDERRQQGGTDGGHGDREDGGEGAWYQTS